MRRSKLVTRIFQYFILSVIVVIVFVPIIILVFGALKTRGELLSTAHSSTLGKHRFDFGEALVFVLANDAQQPCCDALCYIWRGCHL